MLGLIQEHSTVYALFQHSTSRKKKEAARITQPETQIKFNLILCEMLLSSFCSVIFNLIQIPRIQCTTSKTINIDAPKI